MPAEDDSIIYFFKRSAPTDDRRHRIGDQDTINANISNNYVLTPGYQRLLIGFAPRPPAQHTADMREWR